MDAFEAKETKMKRFSAALCLAAIAVGAVPALAQSISAKQGVITTTRTEVKGKQIDKITCRESSACKPACSRRSSPTPLATTGRRSRRTSSSMSRTSIA
ncbi:hypothetical protein GGR89_004189 [Sphingomonas trueperi]|uniref:Uncharacterized protein n=1 Tax=Sphingomonas trueperi TaxID=53317 RepID=A0A7X6BEM8_9SPHN|nr:hypothetical protein [Sphingomonas sp. ABOLD]NJB99843.1 hypothetical protein [Sphingomonas trueperi]